MRSDLEILGVEVPVPVGVHTAPIRVLIAEPDPVSRRLICSLVECRPEMTAECVDGSRLVSSIQENAPDLLILDAHRLAIKRQESWGVLSVKSPPVTIVTAYDPAALAAFASIAVDLLVKPFAAERFETSLDMAKSRIIRVRTELEATNHSIEDEHRVSYRLILAKTGRGSR